MNDDARIEFVERIAHVAQTEGVTEPLPGVRLRRASNPSPMGHGVSFPSFCMVAQGSKEIHLGDRRLTYDTTRYLVSTAMLPISSRVIEAAPDRPFLGFVLVLDPVMVGSVMVEAGKPAPHGHPELSAIDVSAVDAGLFDAALRLIRLTDTPDDARFLAPLIQREIVYRLLVGEQGERMRQITTLGGETNRISEAIARLRADYDKPIRIDTLAQELGMSVSGFHHHFKQVTAMSPLQFQKQLRLQEARRLMLSEDFDATTAGYQVGYDDASHFSREYKRLFGEPPLRDVARLRGVQFEPASV